MGHPCAEWDTHSTEERDTHRNIGQEKDTHRPGKGHPPARKRTPTGMGAHKSGQEKDTHRNGTHRSVSGCPLRHR